MATLPRTSKSSVTSSFLSRPQSGFDTGINTSAAWTERLELGSAPPSDDELNDEEIYHPARALYDFEGKAEFRELSVNAGDDLEVVKEDLADGWSLVKDASGEMGLLPRSYYTFTSEFILAPDLDWSQSHLREASSSTITPRISPRTSRENNKPIVPQHTGDWVFPSFRQSLLRGKSLNRFSSFVTSGAEAWVLKGTVADTVITEASPHNRLASIESEQGDNDSAESGNRLSKGDVNRHFVDAGHAWKEKLPPFRVLVHSPSKRTSALSGAFTVYNVTSLFHGQMDSDTSPGSQTQITVQRRYSQFVILHTALMRRLPGIALPPLPEKQYAGRFSEDFVEARRGDLERYIGRVVRHPVARYAEVVTFFLGCESDIEWKRLIPQHLSMPPAGPSFYAHVYHPAFNIDAEDAEEAVRRFETHTRAVGKGVQGLRNIFGRVREARIEMSKAERLLSYSLLSLITSKPLASAPTTGTIEEDNHYNVKDAGLMNEDGAWCWREGCSHCLKLTKAVQKTSEALQNIGDLYDDHARRRQLATHESLKAVSHPSSIYEGVVSTHKSTLTRYRECTKEIRADEDMAARCETVLNTTMAEMETFHAQKNEDFSTLAKDHLDGEIEFYERVLHRLRTARKCFDEPQYEALAMSPRQPSIYERELENPHLGSLPLLQPCPHVFDSAPMRPVSVAIQEGVGMILGPRGSVFGKFW
ncbi:uncharacterized protein BT62DRAFT_992550 [Guyanagaster necrorhizus]|uniref:PX-domain-containing protein n=1 Tax=Guyanagaster necrorhizus TaxID=856835 RepID=A0A9P8AW20_9AGAR|nr:uncharacterized protein BT62DRAFT_992550 [Guyanagaster necrorhizus MCA 3950]KAG7448492.1 hypothetical protein BT62DRAFT_992550 [Guyanagaster necrorhizus MCA 3950]